ncbi:hypothetical protein [Paenibacillus tyrfis]|uniref:hypothetical protein n=1 Tax=Paenibacillus tyrfis TaxID=1501230 RepID=UPI00209E0B16|nr:hypothetical protein [Paenibacillus tyrfis]MCP1311600.1 hypothetical protein [Paenibacillus tyrfis]
MKKKIKKSLAVLALAGVMTTGAAYALNNPQSNYTTNQVAITEQKKVQTTGVIILITKNGDENFIHIQGAGTNGLVLKANKDTVFRRMDDTRLSLSDLHIGLTIIAEHAMIMKPSLPVQTSVSKVTVLDTKLQSDLIGTAGEIVEVREDESGRLSILISGLGVTDNSPREVVLQLTSDTVLVDRDGRKVEKSAFVKGAKVIGFYQPDLAESLPPIGIARKIVLQ